MKTTILIGTLLILTIIGGCNQNSNERTDIYIGTQGLTMEFIENAPDFDNFENSEMGIGLKLENKGASDAIGKLVLNVEDDYLKIAQQTTQTIQLDGKTKSEPSGKQEIIFFDAITSSLRNMEEVHTSTIYATICYDYQTTLNLDQACVDTNPFNLGKASKACELKDLSFASGEGAPVAITKVSEKSLVSGTKNIVTPFYILTIENLGYGEVVKKGIANKVCSATKFERQDLNKIKIEAYLGTDILECDTDNQGFIHLFEGTTNVKCALEKGIPKTTQTYVTPLNVILEYGYTETISTEFTIKKLEAAALT